MNKKVVLPDITLIAVTSVNIDQTLVALSISSENIEFSSIKLLSPTPPNHKISNIEYVTIPKIDYLGYSRFMIKDLYKYFTTKFCLIIQADGFVIDPNFWKNEFLNYDYIGAPWWYEENNVGNAGFSLISKKMLDFIQKDDVIDLYPSDDDAICRINRKYLEENGIKFAPEELAADFSFEANEIRGEEWDGQFGFHSPSRESERHPNKYRGGITNVDKWEDKDNFRWPF